MNHRQLSITLMIAVAIFLSAVALSAGSRQATAQGPQPQAVLGTAFT